MNNWTINYGFADYIAIETDDDTVCTIELEEHGAAPTKEQIGRAKLIAAAPDLLQACKRVLRCLNMGTAHEMCKRNLELAIAKAESEAGNDSK